MANDYHHIYHLTAPEEQVWTALLNNHNLERALTSNHVSMDSLGTIVLHTGREFVWKIDGEKIVGVMAEVQTPGSSNTKIIFDWRYDMESLHEIWPEGHFARTTIILGDQENHTETRIEMYITNIPGAGEEQNRVRRLWGDKIIDSVIHYVSEHPNLEKAV